MSDLKFNVVEDRVPSWVSSERDGIFFILGRNGFQRIDGTVEVLSGGRPEAISELNVKCGSTDNRQLSAPEPIHHKAADHVNAGTFGNIIEPVGS